MAFKEVLLVALAITSTALALYMFQGAPSVPQKENLGSFLEFNKRFGKSHGSQSELEYRYSIYLDNKKYIEEKNRQNLSFTLGENNFADLTFEEFASKYLSHNIIRNKVFQNNNLKRVFLNGGKDWRKEGKVSAVKNQGACGSCWAFSTIGSLESAYAIKDGQVQTFSEMELVDCSNSYGNNGCNGGLMSNAFDYIKENQVGLSSDYPYRPVQGHCHADKTKTRVSIADYKSISPVDVDGLVSALNNQPVSVAIEVRRDFQLYKGGIYTSDDSCGEALNHGVVAVGYDSAENGDGYFIVKNSWGESWGEQGYVRMAIGSGSGTCGIANDADVYPVL
jgi:C1A family cysteine protease